jgi:hypothetical protein
MSTSTLLQVLFNIDSIESVPGYDLLLGIYFVVKWLFIIADIALVFLLIYALLQGIKYRPHLELHSHGHGKAEKPVRTLGGEIFKKRWEAILRKTAGNSADSLRIAVIEADSMVDDYLKQMGYEGEHMADRLSNLNREEVKTLDKIWAAHRTRNDLVHTPGFYLDPADAKEMLTDYESFLKELGALT